MIFSINQNSFADVTFIQKGQTAAYDGWLFDKDSATEARNAAIDRDRYHLISDSLQKTVDLQNGNLDLQEKRVDLYKTKTDELAKELYDARSTTNWERIGFFMLGIAATVGAAYGISHATR